MHVKFIQPLNWLRAGGGWQLLINFVILQIAWTFDMFNHVPYYAGLLLMLGFPLSPKRHVDFCYKPSGLSYM